MPSCIGGDGTGALRFSSVSNFAKGPRMLQRQTEIAHSVKHISEPCPFCKTTGAELWYDPENRMGEPYQVRCHNCGARGPSCDCGEEAAVPAWLRLNGE